MIAEWLATAPVLLAAFAVVFAPGLLLGAGLHLRGLALWAFAPVASTAMTAVLALVYGIVGIPWSVLTAGIGCALLAGAAWGVGLPLRPSHRPAPPHRRALWLLAAGLFIGILFAVIRFTVYVGDPAAISQTNDAVFHLNAIRYIVETSNASSLHVNSVIGGRSFYPAAWHGLASLVVLMTGVALPVAANLVSLVIAAAVWPLGITWFARVAARGSAGVAASAAALSASLPLFPMLMFQWGVLYSYALAVALVPATVAVVLSARDRIGDEPVPWRPAMVSGLLGLTGLAALALSQPATILAWLILVVSWFVWWAGLRLRGADRASRWRLGLSILVVLAAAAAIWAALSRGTSGSHWPPFRGKVEALLDVVLNGQVMTPFAVGVSILMIAGLVVAVRRGPLRWLATAWLIFAGLYAVCAAVGHPGLRRLLLGAWYADPYRMAALAPITVIPLAAIGLTALATWATVAISGRRGVTAESFGTSWGIAVIAALSAIWFAVAPMVHLARVTEDIIDTESRYQSDEFLDPDERALLERLGEHVPEGERVIGNPSTGTGFGFMLSGVDVYPRTWAHPRTEAWTTIRDGLRDAAADPAVCEALEAYGSPTYVLDFGLGENTPGRFEVPAMTDFGGRPGFELVDEQGDASLWRLTACDP